MGLKIKYTPKGMSTAIDAYAKIDTVVNTVKKDGIHQTVRTAIYEKRGNKIPIEVKEFTHKIENELLVAKEVTVKESLIKEAYNMIKKQLSGEDVLEKGQDIVVDLFKHKLSKRIIWFIVLATTANIGFALVKSYFIW